MAHKEVSKESSFFKRLDHLEIAHDESLDSTLAQSESRIALLKTLMRHYANEALSFELRDKAGDALIYLLKRLKEQSETMHQDCIAADEAPPSFWQRMRQKNWWRMLLRAGFGFMVGCGIINATAEAFDGVSAILFALHTPAAIVLGSCIVLGLFSILLYFAFELTRLSEAMGVRFIERYSEANRLHEMQELLVGLRESYECIQTEALQQGNLRRYQEAHGELAAIYDCMTPAKRMVASLKEERPSFARTAFKYFIAAMAGFLSGAIAFFNGEALLSVVSTLTGLTLGGAWLWLPIVLGFACFLVVTSVSLVNEGKSMMRLIDKLWGKPSKVIDVRLEENTWDMAPQQEAFFSFVSRNVEPKAADDELDAVEHEANSLAVA